MNRWEFEKNIDFSHLDQITIKTYEEKKTNR